MPEWMTDGPSSQLETIELKGFNKEIEEERSGMYSTDLEIYFYLLLIYLKVVRIDTLLFIATFSPISRAIEEEKLMENDDKQRSHS